MNAVKRVAALRADGLAIARWSRSNGKKTSALALPASDAVWIRLNEVVPSERTPQSSPSR
jgi:anti-sigma factor ChrR (cupin superfamily)